MPEPFPNLRLKFDAPLAASILGSAVKKIDALPEDQQTAEILLTVGKILEGCVSIEAVPDHGPAEG